MTNDPSDDRLRQAYRTLTAAADPPSDLGARLHRGVQLRRRYRRRRLAAGVVAVVLLVVGGPAVLAYQWATEVPVTTSPGRTGALPTGQHASCAITDSPETLQTMGWAADATVVGLRRFPFTADARVTLAVTTWYRGGSEPTVTLWMTDPYVGRREEDPLPAYGVGTRLLLGGAVLPDGRLVPFSCGLTRYWDARSAASRAETFR